MEVLCKTWGEMARGHNTFTAMQDKFITTFYIKYTKLGNQGNVCRVPPSFLILFSELENLVKTHPSTWLIAFILSTDHFHKSKLPFNIWYSKVKCCLTQWGGFVTQTSRWSWRMGWVRTWALSIIFAGSAKLLNTDRGRKTITGLMQRTWKKLKSSEKCVFYVFRKHWVHNFTF